jgi:hypothetical protein
MMVRAHPIRWRRHRRGELIQNDGAPLPAGAQIRFARPDAAARTRLLTANNTALVDSIIDVRPRSMPQTAHLWKQAMPKTSPSGKHGDVRSVDELHRLDLKASCSRGHFYLAAKMAFLFSVDTLRIVVPRHMFLV